MPSRSQIAAGVLTVGFACLLLGCGKSGSHLSGKVTFKGQPVPGGAIMIYPDAGAGNSGPSGYATIKNGEFNTAQAGGRPSGPGAVIIKIDGFDPVPPPGAEPDITSTHLFSGYEVKAELPASATVKDIEVPAEAANPKPKASSVPTFVQP